MQRHTLLPGPTAGFTIIELAVTLAIMSLIAGAVLVPFVMQVQQRNIAATEKILAEAKEALMGYAVARGRFPCPASATSNGIEKFSTTSTPAGNESNGMCESGWGYLPAVTLGLTPVDNQGYAIDAWGTPQNRIRYAVWLDPANNNYLFTSLGGMRTAGASELSKASLLHVCSTAAGVSGSPPTCSAGNVLTTNAPVVIWSVGANAATGGTGADEAQNPNPRAEGSTDRVFVSRSRSDVTANAFDDLVTWVSVGSLVSRMVLGGTLP